MGHKSTGQLMFCWLIATGLLLSVMQSAAAAAPKFKSPFCNQNKDCKLTSKSCVKTCPKKVSPSSVGSSSSKSLSGPTCERSYCFEKACVLQKSCGGKQCKQGSDCLGEQRKCAKCIAGRFPGCTTVMCMNGFCHSIPLCSLTLPATPPARSPPSPLPVPPSPPARDFVNKYCRADTDCVFARSTACGKCAPIAAGSQTYPGPGCEKAFCWEYTCQAQKVCGGAPCTTNSDCGPNDKECTNCQGEGYPDCVTNVCANGFCSKIPPCSLGPRPTFVNDSCSLDMDCVYARPLICAGCAFPGAPAVPNGPGCSRAYCYENKCIEQSPCGGKPCSADADCDGASPRMCATCIKGKFPFCTVNKCVNSYCTTIEPCSLTTSSP